MVIWLVGLSGAGKTTIAYAILRLWKKKEKNVVIVDGDEIRAIMKDNECADAHSVAGRRRNAERIFELCCWLDSQDINIVCSILSIFPSLRIRNRERFFRYFEVFVDVPIDVLARRDVKNLYGPAMRGELKNVVGVDIPFPRPEKPDMVIDNSGEHLDVEAIAQEVLVKAGINLE